MLERALANGFTPAVGEERKVLAGQLAGDAGSPLHKVCACIREHAVTDLEATLLAGVEPAQLAEWKAARGPAWRALKQARAEFRRDRLAEIREGGKANERDWRAHVWLLENTHAEGAEDPDLSTPSAAPAVTGGPDFIITPAHLVELQRRRALALEALWKSQPAGAAAA
jgi:hypothetical protein